MDIPAFSPVHFWTTAELLKWDQDNHVSTGEPVVAGWYYQLSNDDMDAPIGPYGSQNAAQAAYDKDDRR